LVFLFFLFADITLSVSNVIEIGYQTYHVILMNSYLRFGSRIYDQMNKTRI